MRRFLNSAGLPAITGRRHDQIELVPQPSDHIVRVWDMISIDDRRDGEYAGVRQGLEVDRSISPLGNRNRNCALISCSSSRTGSTGPRTCFTSVWNPSFGSRPPARAPLGIMDPVGGSQCDAPGPLPAHCGPARHGRARGGIEPADQALT